jgi:DNA-binding CsgD family transcriptional regulator
VPPPRPSPQRCTCRPSPSAATSVSSARASTARPDFTAKEWTLLRAVAEHCRTEDIARAAGVAPADVRALTDDLVLKANTINAAQLVGLAHSWGLFGNTPGQPMAATPAGAAR